MVGKPSGLGILAALVTTKSGKSAAIFPVVEEDRNRGSRYINTTKWPRAFYLGTPKDVLPSLVETLVGNAGKPPVLSQRVMETASTVDIP